MFRVLGSARQGYPASGAQVKAWAQVKADGTMAVYGSHNVSSVTDNGTGDFSVIFNRLSGASSYIFVMTTKTGAAAGTRHFQQTQPLFLNEGTIKETLFFNWSGVVSDPMMFYIAMIGEG